MFFIPVILGSTRKGRQSIKPAKYILRRLGQQPQVETELIDLAEYDFPIMEERLRFLKPEEVPPHLLAFSEKIARADAIVIVSPEYNNGYPGVLKNALDYLLPEYKRKPIAIVSVSAGGFGGLNCLAQLRLVALGMGALPIPTSLPISHVGDSFDDEGNPKDPSFERRSQAFLDEVLWFTEAITTQRTKEQVRQQTGQNTQ